VSAAEDEPPPPARVRWRRAHRVIPSRFPPIDLFERIADPADWDALAELETLTNPRAREQWGEISLVPPARRVSGPGASWLMAPFTHVNRQGSRFGDGRYGVYYAANDLKTAVAETIHHMGRFYAATAQPPARPIMRVLVGKTDLVLDDVRRGYDRLHDPDSYVLSQRFGRARRIAGANGIVFRSVRRQGGENIAVFWPDVLSPPVQERHLVYEWDGSAIVRWYDAQEETWNPVPR
jgi:hypothetical protein